MCISILSFTTSVSRSKHTDPHMQTHSQKRSQRGKGQSPAENRFQTVGGKKTGIKEEEKEEDES